MDFKLPSKGPEKSNNTTQSGAPVQENTTKPSAEFNSDNASDNLGPTNIPVISEGSIPPEHDSKGASTPKSSTPDQPRSGGLSAGRGRSLKLPAAINVSKSGKTGTPVYTPTIKTPGARKDPTPAKASTPPVGRPSSSAGISSSRFAQATASSASRSDTTPEIPTSSTRKEGVQGVSKASSKGTPSGVSRPNTPSGIQYSPSFPILQGPTSGPRQSRPNTPTSPSSKPSPSSSTISKGYINLPSLSRGHRPSTPGNKPSPSSVASTHTSILPSTPGSKKADTRSTSDLEKKIAGDLPLFNRPSKASGTDQLPTRGTTSSGPDFLAIPHSKTSEDSLIFQDDIQKNAATSTLSLPASEETSEQNPTPDSWLAAASNQLEELSVNDTFFTESSRKETSPTGGKKDQDENTESGPKYSPSLYLETDETSPQDVLKSIHPTGEEHKSTDNPNLNAITVRSPLVGNKTPEQTSPVIPSRGLGNVDDLLAEIDSSMGQKQRDIINRAKYPKFKNDAQKALQAYIQAHPDEESSNLAEAALDELQKGDTYNISDFLHRSGEDREKYDGIIKGLQQEIHELKNFVGNGSSDEMISQSDCDAKYAGEKFRLDAMIEDLENDSKKNSEKIKRMEKDITDLKEENATMAENESLDLGSINDLQSKNELLTEEKEGIAVQLKQANEEKYDLKVENEKLRKEKEDLESSNANLLKENSTLEANLKKCHGSHAQTVTNANTALQDLEKTKENEKIKQEQEQEAQADSEKAILTKHQLQTSALLETHQSDIKQYDDKLQAIATEIASIQSIPKLHISASSVPVATVGDLLAQLQQIHMMVYGIVTEMHGLLKQEDVDVELASRDEHHKQEVDALNTKLEDVYSAVEKVSQLDEFRGNALGNDSAANIHEIFATIERILASRRGLETELQERSRRDGYFHALLDAVQNLLMGGNGNEGLDVKLERDQDQLLEALRLFIAQVHKGEFITTQECDQRNMKFLNDLLKKGDLITPEDWEKRHQLKREEEEELEKSSAPKLPTDEEEMNTPANSKEEEMENKQKAVFFTEALELLQTITYEEGFASKHIQDQAAAMLSAIDYISVAAEDESGMLTRIKHDKLQRGLVAEIGTLKARLAQAHSSVSLPTTQSTMVTSSSTTIEDDAHKNQAPKGEIKNLKAKIEALEAKIEELETASSTTTTTSEVDERTSQDALDKCQQTNEEYKDQLTSLTTQISDLKKQLNEAENNAAKATETVANWEEEREEYEESINFLTDENSKLDAQIKKLQAKSGSAAISEDTSAASKDDVMSLTTASANEDSSSLPSTALSACEKEKLEFQETINDLILTNADLETHLQKLQAESAAATSEVQIALNAAQKTVEDNKDLINSLFLQIDDLQAKIRSLEAKIGGGESGEIQSPKSADAFAKCKQSNARFKTEINNLTAEIKTLQREVVDSETKHRELGTEKKELETIVEELKTAIEDLEDANQKLEKNDLSRIIALPKESPVMGTEVNTQAGEVEGLRRKIPELKAIILDLEQHDTRRILRLASSNIAASQTPLSTGGPRTPPMNGNPSQYLERITIGDTQEQITEKVEGMIAQADKLKGALHSQAQDITSQDMVVDPNTHIEEVERFKKRIMEVQDQLNREKRSHQVLKNSYEVLQEEQARLLTEINRLNAVIHDYSTKIDQWLDFEKQCMAAHQQEDGAKAEVVTELDATKRDVLRLEAGVKVLERELNSKSDLLKAAIEAENASTGLESPAFDPNQRVILDLREQIRTLEEELKLAKDQAKAATEGGIATLENRTTSASCRPGTKTILDLEAQIHFLEETIETTKEEHAKDLKELLHSTKSTCDQEKRGKDALIGRLRNELSILSGGGRRSSTGSDSDSDKEGFPVNVTVVLKSTRTDIEFCFVRTEDGLNAMAAERRYYGYTPEDTRSARDASDMAKLLSDAMPDRSQEKEMLMARSNFWSGITAYYADNADQANILLAGARSVINEVGSAEEQHYLAWVNEGTGNGCPKAKENYQDFRLGRGMTKDVGSAFASPENQQQPFEKKPATIRKSKNRAKSKKSKKVRVQSSIQEEEPNLYDDSDDKRVGVSRKKLKAEPPVSFKPDQQGESEGDPSKISAKLTNSEDTAEEKGEAKFPVRAAEEEGKRREDSQAEEKAWTLLPGLEDRLKMLTPEDQKLGYAAAVESSPLPVKEEKAEDADDEEAEFSIGGVKSGVSSIHKFFDAFLGGN